MARTPISALSEVFPRELGRALAALGDYVYAYYRPGEFRPFYVGKGTGARVLQHWREATSSKQNPKAHEHEILSILKSGAFPVIKLLAYNLEDTTPGAVYSTVERALQDAFGIQMVWEKKASHQRRIPHEAALLQTREDSAKHPVLSLEAVLAKADLRKTVTKQELGVLVGAPTLVVGLSKTYHPSYEPGLVAEMARQFWRLDRFENTTLQPFRKSNEAVLLAWSSMTNKAPMVVGAWRVKPRSVKLSASPGRYKMDVVDAVDLPLRKLCLGLRLSGTGNNWEGPRLIIPD